MVERTKQTRLTLAAQCSVAALIVLGLLGGSLILAHGGFETSSKRGGASVFVPVPQSYVMVATMYGMSVVGLIALLRARAWLRRSIAIGILLYAFVAISLVAALGRT